MNFNTNFSSPFFNYGSNFNTGASNKYSNSGYNYKQNYQPTFDTTTFNNINAGCTKTNINTSSSQDQASTSVTNTNMAQMMIQMMQIMMQMMQNMTQNSGTGTSTSTSGDGTSASNAADLTTASDSTLTSAQNNIASQFATPGSSTAASNKTLTDNIASADPTADTTTQSLVSLINTNPNANPQAVQSYALLQTLRRNNSVLDSLNSQTGFSTAKSEANTNKTNIISSLQTLQTRPLSTEELNALPLDNQVKTVLTANSLTSSQIMDLNAYNDRDASYTPPGGVYFNTTQPSTLTPLQSQYLFYQGQQVA